jgi:hypothetical protein
MFARVCLVLAAAFLLAAQSRPMVNAQTPFTDGAGNTVSCPSGYDVDPAYTGSGSCLCMKQSGPESVGDLTSIAENGPPDVESPVVDCTIDKTGTSPDDQLFSDIVTGDVVTPPVNQVSAAPERLDGALFSCTALLMAVAVAV